MIAHTFLFEEGLWDVSGETVGADGDVRETTGEARIVHWPGVWLIEARTERSENEDAGETSVEVTPALEGRDHTTWTAFDSVLGKQHGHYAFLGDSILSVFVCGDGKQRGSEIVRRLDDDVYESMGALFEGDRKISSWTRRFTRRTPG